MRVILWLERMLWSGPLLAALMGSHIYFTVSLRGVQRWTLRGIRRSLRRERGAGGVSSFGALTTALAAAVGTGNIVGVATAVALGGPGAVLWCWLTGVLGMATRYAEAWLSLRYRVRRRDGTLRGGPMYVMERRLHRPGLARCFSALGVLAALGTGALIQSNAIAEALPGKAAWTGAAVTALAALVILGGVGTISRVSEALVPAMAGLYLLGCLGVLWGNRAALPEAVRAILAGGLSLRAAGGGLAGRAVLTAARYGTARGLFTNESGMGTAPMAAAAAEGGEPVEEALASMTGVFWDTVVICAMTGLTVVSAMTAYPERFAGASPGTLCFLAFETVPGGTWILTVSLVAFAFATVIGWCWYGECCWQYLAGERRLGWYRTGYLLAVFLGALGGMETVWSLGSVLAGLMAAPNLYCLWQLRRETADSVQGLVCRKSGINSRFLHKNEI